MCLLSGSAHLLFEPVPLISPELCVIARLAGPQASGAPATQPPLTIAGVTDRYHGTQLSTWVLEIQSQVLELLLSCRPNYKLFSPEAGGQ